MTVDDGEQYTVPSLAALEHNLEAAMHKVRSEKDRKIGGEMSYLENMVSVYCTPLRSTRLHIFHYAVTRLINVLFRAACRSGGNKLSATAYVTR